jgi:hypothetical protein
MRWRQDTSTHADYFFHSQRDYRRGVEWGAGVARGLGVGLRVGGVGVGVAPCTYLTVP